MDMDKRPRPYFSSLTQPNGSLTLVETSKTQLSVMTMCLYVIHNKYFQSKGSRDGTF